MHTDNETSETSVVDEGWTGGEMMWLYILCEFEQNHTRVDPNEQGQQEYSYDIERRKIGDQRWSFSCGLRLPKPSDTPTGFDNVAQWYKEYDEETHHELRGE